MNTQEITNGIAELDSTATIADLDKIWKDTKTMMKQLHGDMFWHMYYTHFLPMKMMYQILKYQINVFKEQELTAAHWEAKMLAVQRKD